MERSLLLFLMFFFWPSLRPSKIASQGSNTMRSRWAVVAMMILVLASFFSGCDSARHYVGGDLGWDASTHLEEWSDNSTFVPGDSLVFIYLDEYNVVEVSQLGYLNCDYTNPIAVYSGGRTEINLTQPETRYFTSSLVEPCAMSLEVQVQREA